jgi:hypothetical protein
MSIPSSIPDLDADSQLRLDDASFQAAADLTHLQAEVLEELADPVATSSQRLTQVSWIHSQQWPPSNQEMWVQHHWPEWSIDPFNPTTTSTSSQSHQTTKCLPTTSWSGLLNTSTTVNSGPTTIQAAGCFNHAEYTPFSYQHATSSAAAELRTTTPIKTSHIHKEPLIWNGRDLPDDVAIITNSTSPLRTYENSLNIITSSKRARIASEIGTATADSITDARNVAITRANSVETVAIESALNQSTTSHISRTASSTSSANGIWQKLRPTLIRLQEKETPTSTKTKKSSTANWLAVFRRRNWITLERLQEAIRQNDKDALEFLASLKRNDNFKRFAGELVFQAKLLAPQLTYEQALNDYAIETDALTDEIMCVVNAVYRLIRDNVRVEYSRDARIGDVWFRIALMFQCLCGNLGKKRGLLFDGPPSSGKSFVVAMLTSLYPIEQVGQFIMQASISSFWLQPLIGKAIYVGEEIKLTPNSAQTVKLLLEGSANLTTDVKFAEGADIPYRPTIMTSNGPCYQLVMAEGNAFHERSVEMHFNAPIELGGLSRNRTIHAHAIAYLAAQAYKRYPATSEKGKEPETLDFVPL